MATQYRQLPFERFADDAIGHYRTEQQAQEIRAAIAARLKDGGLELHPEKTKVVYCRGHWCPVKHFVKTGKSIVFSSIVGIRLKNDLN